MNMKFLPLSYVLCLFLLFIFSCKQKSTTLFTLLDSGESGIQFSNVLTESDTLNILKEEYFYNGGGVGTGDFNNDGFPDLFFTGNMTSNKLYLNKGNIQFEDITETARVTGEGRWCSGVTVADVNADGLMDIYVSASFKIDPSDRANLLYINQGLNEEKIPVFREEALKYGIADTSYTTHSAFLDYDKDGDLDLYLLNTVINQKLPGIYRDKITDGSAINNDKLYRNNGNQTFTDVTKEAGILIEGYGLGVSVCDINQDGWSDIYISNDYLSNDILYINNKNGTFTDKITEYFKHTCLSAMGNDVVDINNDSYPDVIALDMLPEKNKRRKMMLKSNNYITYINNDKYKYQHQYVRNVLQLNQGMTEMGHPVFSEIGQLSGVHQTDWSWTPLVADFDNDGYRDIIITNGFPRDISDMDFGIYRSGPAGAIASDMFLVDSIPEVKISNYAFRNSGDFVFNDVTNDWGLNIPSFSNGAVYVDLDLDGDLDVVINNINSKAFVFRNELNNRSEISNHFLRIDFEEKNASSAGIKVQIFYDGKQQYYEHTPYRGYLSTVENIAHFGLGSVTKIDSLNIYWPDGSFQSVKNVSADKKIIIKKTNSEVKKIYIPVQNSSKPLLREISDSISVKYKHKEHDKVDFNIQRTLPHKFSQLGPGVTVGDVNGDGLEDFYIPGASGYRGLFFIQSEYGKFTIDSTRIKKQKNKFEEELSGLFFDCDNDTDLDLYVVNGSYEFEKDSRFYQDYLYINNGKGYFQADSVALPITTSSGSCVRAADYDKDGDLDLFIGGRVVPGQYPTAPESYLLQNNKGKFTNVTREYAKGLETIGMITDAIWTDFDSDGSVDLIIVGEWMPITLFRNINRKLVNVTSETGLAEYKGWWNSISAGDFDNDGDIDYVAGNLGLNTNYVASKQQPLKVYAKDFDKNGRFKAILSCYMKSENNQLASYPIHTRDDIAVEMPGIKKKFPRYSNYGVATMEKVLNTEERESALVLTATYFSTSYIENHGNNKFTIIPLPVQAQFAPVNGIICEDIDMDGNLDLLLIGNDYSTEVFTGRYDASVGLLLKGNGKGKFLPLGGLNSGFLVDGDAKALVKIYSPQNEELFIASQNLNRLKVFKRTQPLLIGNQGKTINIEPEDFYAIISYKDGKKSRKEFYHGSSYLSQSSRNFKVDPQINQIEFFSFTGKSRIVKF